MSFFSDYITVLTVRYPRDAVMTKRLFRAANGAVGKTDYDDALKFDVQKVGINDLADLCGVLISLARQPNQVAIRGLPLSHHNVSRRLYGDEAAFAADADGHHWLFADFDDVPLPIFLDPDDDPEIIIGYLVRLLPPAFHNVSFYWQWSCGHGLDGGKTLRAHLFFWSSEKHTDKEYENWAKWVNGAAGWKMLDYCVLRTVQPNYTAAPIVDEGVDDPIPSGRNGIHIGEMSEVVIDIPSLEWKEHVRLQERDEYAELVEYGLRQPADYADVLNGKDRYLDYLKRIGDDLDGFHDPMTKAIWHWARVYPPDQDEDFKHVLRCVVRSAECTKQRDLDEYLSDYRLDASLRGAREKQPERRPQNALERYRSGLRFSLSHSRKG